MLKSKIRFNLRNSNLRRRTCATQTSDSTGSKKDALNKFLEVVKDTQATAFNKVGDEVKSDAKSSISSIPVEQVKFTKLFRQSALVKQGNIKNGFFAPGTITHVADQTIFIDYGGKFPFITRKPEREKEAYVRGAKVLLKVLDWELTARFIGMDTDSTLCESEARIVELLSSPWNQNAEDTLEYSAERNSTFSTKVIDDYLKNKKFPNQKNKKVESSSNQTNEQTT